MIYKTLHRKPMFGQHELHKKKEDELLLYSACVKSDHITKYSSVLCAAEQFEDVILMKT